MIDGFPPDNDPGDFPDEPARNTSGAVAIVGAVIGLLIAFGVALTPEQENAILKVVLIGYPAVVFVVGWAIRQQVFSPRTAQAKLNEAYEAGRIGLPQPELALPPGQ